MGFSNGDMLSNPCLRVLAKRPLLTPRDSIAAAAVTQYVSSRVLQPPTPPSGLLLFPTEEVGRFRAAGLRAAKRGGDEQDVDGIAVSEAGEGSQVVSHFRVEFEASDERVRFARPHIGVYLPRSAPFPWNDLEERGEVPGKRRSAWLNNIHAAFPSFNGATTEDDCAMKEIALGDFFGGTGLITSCVGVDGFNTGRTRNVGVDPDVDVFAVP